MENRMQVNKKLCRNLIKHLKKGGGEIFTQDLEQELIRRQIHIYAYWDLDGCSDDSVLIQVSFNDTLPKISFIAWGISEAVEIIFSIYRAEGRASLRQAY